MAFSATRSLCREHCDVRGCARASEETPAPVEDPAVEAAEEVTRSPAEAVEEKADEPTFRRIGPVTTITEVSTGLPFPARVDTGATTCSIHYEAIEIEDAAENPEDNVGKRIRIVDSESGR